jgi:hypothetical protein
MFGHHRGWLLLVVIVVGSQGQWSVVVIVTTIDTLPVIIVGGLWVQILQTVY